MKPVLRTAPAPHSNVSLTTAEIINRCRANVLTNTSSNAAATHFMFTLRHMLLSECKNPYICVLHIVGRSMFKQHIIICVAYFGISTDRCSYCLCITPACAVTGYRETGLHANACCTTHTLCDVRGKCNDLSRFISRLVCAENIVLQLHDVLRTCELCFTCEYIPVYFIRLPYG